MTKRQAERICGLPVVLSANVRGMYECGIYLENHGEPPIVSGLGRLETEAVSKAVEANYKRVSRQVFAEQSYRCFVCARIAPLQCDHIKPRARGERDDRRENLRGCDAECHRQITDNILKDPPPHPRVLASVRRHGWDWSGHGWVSI